MAHYTVTIEWKRDGAKFLDHKYQRSHTWTFENGLTLKAAASSHIVGDSFTDPSAIDPEEAFTASVASCHMLWFLSIAAGRGFVVNKYSDHSEGVLEKNGEGKLAITRIYIKPVVSFEADNAPGREDFLKLHQEAHRKCFIANSIKSEIEISPKMETVQNL
ncbi:OsmC family protein [Rhodohalobacter sp.]|uniref:OsmC family protein n=1 Tax=Rhodohalobacter sp. TaxID=1974210 RepID=UPI002ACD4B15|nr:OsmC family protein [Rhodohalobacter sp.]MDZ7757875.1 OsmC family protein [Rhodohalobacter sp.]